MFQVVMLGEAEKRILDANRNRITEALRVAEDVLRFAGGRAGMAVRGKRLRHRVFRIFERLEKRECCELILSRRSHQDEGRKGTYDRAGSGKKTHLPLLAKRNLRRACEGIRVCEEICRNAGHEDLFLMFKAARFDTYLLEKDLAGKTAVKKPRRP